MTYISGIRGECPPPHFFLLAQQVESLRSVVGAQTWSTYVSQIIDTIVGPQT